MTDDKRPPVYQKEGRELVRAWWRDLQDDPGGRAQLRRAANLLEVFLCPAFHRLLHKVSGSRDDLALAAGVLACLKEEGGPECFAQALATPKAAGGRACMSGLRFRRLVRIDDREELLRQMRRAPGLGRKQGRARFPGRRPLLLEPALASEKLGPDLLQFRFRRKIRRLQ